MNDEKKAQVDAEAILMTLDQIGQTIEVMTSVVGRLRGYITEQHDAEQNSNEQSQDSLEDDNTAPATLH